MTISLLDPKYMGGLIAAGGYHFEDSYVLSQIPSWLSLPSFQAFQQEGWADVEVFFETGGRWFIAIKDHQVTPAEFRDIVNDFRIREDSDAGQYERYIVASVGLSKPVIKLEQQLKRFRAATSYTESELASTRARIVSTITELRLEDLADFIIEKVFFDSDAAQAKDEAMIRNAFTGFLVHQYGINAQSADDLYLRTARLLVVERGAPIESLVFLEALKQKQLEDIAGDLSQFDLVTPAFLNRYQDDNARSLFYDGAVPTWSDIVHRRDIPRDIIDEIISQVKQWDKGRLLVPILAEAGEGKSTLLHRMAAALAADNRVVLYHRREALTADAREVERIAEMAGRCVYVFIDDAARIHNFDGFIKSLAELPNSIVVIAASRPYEWVPLRSIYSANIELGLTASGREYFMEGLTDHEMELLFRRLADAGLIRSLSDEELKLAIDFHGKTTKRKLLVLVLELTRGKRVVDIVRDEIDRIRKMGDDLFRAYRYICLMASVHSFMTEAMLAQLVSVNNVKLDIVGRLPGLVEAIGEKIYPRHDRIGEIATDIMFDGADEERGDLLCQLISLAFKEGELDAVRSMVRAQMPRSVPCSQALKVMGCLVDEAYCAGELDLTEAALKELPLDFERRDISLDLLAAKTPLLWEQVIFPVERRLIRVNWDGLQSVWSLPFSWPECPHVTEREAVSNVSLKEGLRWAEVYGLAASEGGKYEGFFTLITELMYTLLSVLHPGRAEIDFKHGEFLMHVLRDEDAATLYNRALEKDPDYAEAHAGLAISLYTTGDYDGALRHYKIARGLDRESVFRVLFGDVFREMLERLGELEELVEYRKDSIKDSFGMMRRLEEAGGHILRIANLRVPETQRERLEWEAHERLVRRDFSEKEEQRTIAALDEFLNIVKTLPPEQRDELGKRMAPWFGELRRESSSDGTLERNEEN